MFMFTPQERQVYSCPFTNRAYDPLAVRRVLLASGKFSTLCADKTEAGRAELTALARKAFGLQPIQPDGSGVLDAVVWDALCAFTRYLRGKEPRAQTTPASVPCTESPAPSPTTATSP